MTIQDAFCKNLNKRMESYGLTGMSNRELARKSGISDTHISNLRHNNRTPNLYTAYVISKVFGCKIDDMLEGCDE